MILNVHAGHNPDGKTACGAIGLIRESTEARKVKDLVIAYLRKQGHTVYDCTEENGKNRDDVLVKIVKKCNAHKVDLDVSIHFNAMRNDYVGDGKTGGTEVFVYNTTGTSYKYAVNICNEISKMGYYNRGVKVNSGLYVLKNTNAQAILIECCFVDDKDDINLYDADKMAKAIVKGITGHEVVVRQADTINDFKKWLNGYLSINLPLDNKYDANTRKASIMAFQKYAGLDKTGHWNTDCKMAAKLSRMHPRIGDSNDLVKLVQGEMLANGIYSGKIDGVFGNYTKEVVLYFQKYWKLNEHGVVGTQVWNKLYE